MKALFLAFVFLAGQARAVSYSPAPTALYDVEQNVSDTVGTNHGTAVSTTYGTTGAWSNTYAANGGYFTAPVALVGVTGTVEFSYRTAAFPANSLALFGIGHNAQRALEIYQFGGNLYAFDAAAGVNASFQAYSANTNYYIKQTWNASRRIIWIGTWTNQGTVTLTRVTNVANTYLNGTINSINCRAGYGVSATDGPMDFFAFRNVFDDSSTIVAPVSSGATQEAPTNIYQMERKSNMVHPQWWRRGLGAFLWFIPTSKAWAIIQDGQEQQAEANQAWWLDMQAKLTKTPTPRPTNTPNPSWAKTPTPGPTATATPTPNP